MTANLARDRDIGWFPTSRNLAWAATGGLVAAVVTGVVIHMMGMMTGLPAQIVGSDSVAVGWVVHLIAGVVTALAYGLFVRTPSLGRGALYGAIFGMMVGIFLVWIAGNLIVSGSIPPLVMTGLMEIMLHIVWGVIVGVVAAWGIRRTAEEERTVRHARAV